jgi:hypothetical protein
LRRKFFKATGEVISEEQFRLTITLPTKKVVKERSLAFLEATVSRSYRLG